MKVNFVYYFRERKLFSKKNLEELWQFHPRGQVSFPAFWMRPDIVFPSPSCRKCMSSLSWTLYLGQFKSNIEGPVIALTYFLSSIVSFSFTIPCPLHKYPCGFPSVYPKSHHLPPSLQLHLWTNPRISGLDYCRHFYSPPYFHLCLWPFTLKTVSIGIPQKHDKGHDCHCSVPSTLIRVKGNISTVSTRPLLRTLSLSLRFFNCTGLCCFLDP